MGNGGGCRQPALVRDVEFLRFPDGRLEPTLALRRALTRLVRRYRPATVFAHDPTAHLFEGYINHPDHRAASEVLSAAAWTYVAGFLQTVSQLFYFTVQALGLSRGDWSDSR